MTRTTPYTGWDGGLMQVICDAYRTQRAGEVDVGGE